MKSTSSRLAIIIRPMRRTDAKEVASLMSDLAKFHGDRSVSTAKDFIKNCLGSKRLGTIMVSVSKSKVVGFALYYDCMNCIEGNVRRRLDLLAISPEYRKQGVGQKLLAYVAKDCLLKKIASLHIEAHIENKAAQKFYEALLLKGTITNRVRYICNPKDFKRLILRSL